jgi:hypothetical protein
VRKIQALANVLHRPLRMLDSGRVAAVELAKTAVRNRRGSPSEGTKRSGKRCYKVYAIPGHAWKDLSNRRIQNAF